MDQRRFDAMIRALQTGTTRRRGLAAALAALFGGAAGEAAARGKSAGNRHGTGDGGGERSRPGGRPGPAGPCGDSPEANACKRNGDCCTKYCDAGRCRCKSNWMTCGADEHCCSGRCLGRQCDGGAKPAGASCAEDFNCDSGLSCIKNVCTKGGNPSCGPRNCTGCCVGTTCRTGKSIQGCGVKGAACEVCGAGQSCNKGACVAPPGPPPAPACGPANCAGGCCKDGQCVTATNGLACGTGGAACVTCSSLTPLCKTGACAAGTWTAQTPLGAGQPASGADNDQFHQPYGVGISPDGLTLYVGDYSNTRVGVWTRASAAAGWQAQAPLLIGTSGQSFPEFDLPVGVTPAADGLTLYVADSNRARVDILTRTSTSAAWQPQTPLGQNGDFFIPENVAATADGLELYISDLGNRINRWTRATAAAAWQAQSPIGAGKGSATDKFDSPVGVALTADGLELFVGDTNNSRVSVWSRTSTTAAWQPKTIIGSDGSANNQFSYLEGLALSADGLSLYVADTYNNRIAVWTRASATAAWQAQTPLGAGQPTGGIGDAQFNWPHAVALSPDAAELYVADGSNNRIAVWKQI